MATTKEFDNLDAEVKELLLNYKHKRATAYEPCTLKNIKECLIGLSEVSTFNVIQMLFSVYIVYIKTSI